jgi:hypothetical protein
LAAKGTGSLDLKEIISDLIPAFSTSIYGLVLAFLATCITKIVFAYEDAALANTLKYKDPEAALQALDDHVLALTEAEKQNNEKLTDSIAKQSEILSKFVDSFIQEMQGCFTAMNTVVEERVTNFGTTQFTQSREILEGITRQLGDQAKTILDSHKESVKTMTESSSSDMEAIRTALTDAVEKLKTDTVSGIEALTQEQTAKLQRLSEDSLNLHMQSAEEQRQFNESLLNKMSTSLTDTTGRIVEGLNAQIDVLKQAIGDNVEQLQQAYDFITEKSASIVSNYEQATEAYQDAVQNAHDLNERVEKGLDKVGDGLTNVGKTNENVNKIIDMIENKETNMEAIVMRIESLNNAIESLQRLESVLSRIAPK